MERSRGRRTVEDDEDDAPRGRSRGRESESRRGGGFVYKQRDPNVAKKRGDQSANDFDVIIRDDLKSFTPEGDKIIRILPPTWDSPEHFGLDLHVHYGIGPDNQSYLCLDKMKGEPCPICEERARAQADGDSDYADQLKPTKRVLYALVDRDHEKEGVQFWAAPWTIDRDICKLVVDKRTGDTLAIDDPEDGYDVEFSRTGKGINTKYTGISISRRPSELGNDKWLDFMVENPLTEILVYKDYDYIAKIFGSGGSRDSRDSDRKSSRRSLDDEQETDLRKGEMKRGKSLDDEKPSFKDVMKMSYDELCSVIDSFKLKINPEDSSDDDELAEWICEDLGLKEESSSKLSEMKRKRLD